MTSFQKAMQKAMAHFPSDTLREWASNEHRQARRHIQQAKYWKQANRDYYTINLDNARMCRTASRTLFTIIRSRAS